MVFKVLLHLLLSFQFCSLEDQCHFDPELFVSDLFFVVGVVVMVMFVVVVFLFVSESGLETPVF